jgi:hypothetical protein
MNTGLFLLADTMKNSWTADVELNNGQVISIWYTAWHSCKNTVRNIISISSDYPCRQASKTFIN